MDKIDTQGMSMPGGTINPKQVYTVHGSTKELAKLIQKQLGINAQPLPKYGQTSIEKYN